MQKLLTVALCVATAACAASKPPSPIKTTMAQYQHQRDTAPPRPAVDYELREACDRITDSYKWNALDYSLGEMNRIMDKCYPGLRQRAAAQKRADESLLLGK